jgi:RHS repeat-associated protein
VWSIRDFSGNVLRQYEGYDQMPGMSWLWIEDYMYRAGQLLAGERVPEEGGRRHFHLDHLGSPRLVTGQDSKEMSERDHEPFGLESNPLYQETAGGFDREDPKRFTGHERDYAAPPDSPASAYYLDYMHARFYAPNVGRFLSVDPVLKVKGAMLLPQGWNRYAYVVNNPLRYTDPTGQYVCHGTTQECNEIKFSLNVMRFAAARMSLADGRSQMQRVVDAYGKDGDATTKISGVWANPRKADGSQLLQPDELGRAGRGNVFVSLNNIGAKANRSASVAFAILAGTLTHEADHELQPAFMSLRPGERPSRLSLMFYEFQAYTLERSFYRMSEHPGLAPDPTTGAALSTDRDCAAAGCNP